VPRSGFACRRPAADRSPLRARAAGRCAKLSRRARRQPLFVGRCVAALAADPKVAAKNGRVHASWDLADEYGVVDADGSRPHFVRWLRENMPEVAAGWKKLDDAFYAYWGKMRYGMPGAERR